MSQDEGQANVFLSLLRECRVSREGVSPEDAQNMARTTTGATEGGGPAATSGNGGGETLSGAVARVLLELESDDELDLGDDDDDDDNRDFFLRSDRQKRRKGPQQPGHGGEDDDDDDDSSSITLSLPPSFDDSLDISPLLPSIAREALLRGGGGSGGGGGGGIPTTVGDTLGSSSVKNRMLNSRLAELEAQVEHLTHSKKMLELRALNERQQWAAKFQELNDRWSREVELLRQTQDDTEGELKSLRDQLDDEKDYFRDLVLSDALYLELSRKPEEKMTLKEFISFRAHKVVKPVKDELEKTRRNLQDSQETLSSVTEQLELQVRELARQRVTGEAREEGMKLQIATLTDRVNELEMALELAIAKNKEIREKEEKYDRLYERTVAAEKELDHLRMVSQTQAQALAAATNAEKTLQVRGTDLAHQAEILQMDKQYLTKELENALSKANTLEREGNRLHDRVLELERNKEELTQCLGDLKERSKIVYEERLNGELERLRTESAKEIADLKTSAKEMVERENRVLREARADALAEADRARLQLQELSKSHEDLLFRLSRCEASYESTISELRSELKMKSFELSRLGVIYEEKAAALQQAEYQASILRAQVDVHQKEFVRLEATSTARVNELMSALEAERAKVKSYEDLEHHLDEAIVRTGIVSGGDTESTAGLEAFERIPTAPQRRMRHAMHLAHKVSEKEREVAHYRKQLNEAKDTIERLERRSMELETILENATQPGRYVVDLVREKDMELDRLRAKVAELQLQVELGETDMRRVLEEKTQIQRELQRLLAQREELQALRSLINEAQRGESLVQSSGGPLLPSPTTPTQQPPSNFMPQAAAVDGGGGGGGGSWKQPSTPRRSPAPEAVLRYMDPSARIKTTPRYYQRNA